ncbi:MAG TPA: hydroxysqualene dehydroxylase HpnE [Terriglobales bacterium]|nr:hydroxysqualene dehydroxylase HpnE [Terriglobales bacterium]
MTSAQSRRSVAIVGGGLAGLAAGCALSDSGFVVTVYERRPYLGGRASSYEHPGTGEVVDNCQHVLLGCCTSLTDFYHRIGVEDQIRWYDRLTFMEPGGRVSEIGMSGLPAPLHTAPSFLGARMLSFADKLAITRAMLALMPRMPEDDGRNFLEWLKQHGQTERAIERFWKVILVSALNEELDRVSVNNAAMVFRESFLKSAQAGRMGVPTVPLTELYGKAGDYIAAHGGRIEMRASVEGMQASIFRKSATGLTSNPERVADTPIDPAVKLCIRDRDGSREVLPDFALLAVPFDSLERIVPDSSESRPLRALLGRFETSPITGVHLWFDRQITGLEHAVLLDRTIQWMFHKSKIQNRQGADSGSYVELVISASKTLLEKSRGEIIELCVRELTEFFPAVRDAELLKATVIKEVHATFSPVPGSDAYRPTSETPWPQVSLAGDWTATGWPATMEGAVRSGYLAAEAICRAAGIERRFLVPNLPATGLMRLLG